MENLLTKIKGKLKKIKQQQKNSKTVLHFHLYLLRLFVNQL